MPYIGQHASKTGHAEFIENPEVEEFLLSCEYLKQPTPEQAADLVSGFKSAPMEGRAPELVYATDGSRYEAPLNKTYPSTRVGYVKISALVIDVLIYKQLCQHAMTRRSIDPLKVNELQNSADALTFSLPSANLRYHAAETVQDGFRLRILEHFDSSKTAIPPTNRRLIDTLYHLAVLSGTKGGVGVNDERFVVVETCPNCGYKPPNGFQIPRSELSLKCTNSEKCSTTIYATDILRLHEDVSEFSSNEEALTRVMNAVEHLLVAHYLREYGEAAPGVLGALAFMIDGPLALFGQPAWLSRPLQALIFDTNARLAKLGYPACLIIGLQKQGQLGEHAAMLSPYLKAETFAIVDDDYRNRYIRPVKDGSNFGDETYYGQDFLFCTSSNTAFVLGIPYPLRSKKDVGNFKTWKASPGNYDQLRDALELVRLFECDLYASSLVPVILAHRHASISNIPGGKVLDIASAAKVGAHAAFAT